MTGHRKWEEIKNNVVGGGERHDSWPVIERTDVAQQDFQGRLAAMNGRAPDFYNGQTAYDHGLREGRREAAIADQDRHELYEQGLRAGYGKGATERNTLTVNLHAQFDRISVIHHMVMHREPYGDIEHFILFGDET